MIILINSENDKNWYYHNNDNNYRYCTTISFVDDTTINAQRRYSVQKHKERKPKRKQKMKTNEKNTDKRDRNTTGSRINEKNTKILTTAA